jgi:hypothetical protein
MGKNILCLWLIHPDFLVSLLPKNFSFKIGSILYLCSRSEKGRCIKIYLSKSVRRPRNGVMIYLSSFQLIRFKFFDVSDGETPKVVEKKIEEVSLSDDDEEEVEEVVADKRDR